MRRNSGLIALLAACCFILGCSQFSILGMLDSMANSTGLSVAPISRLTTMHSCSNALDTPLTLVATALVLEAFVVLRVTNRRNSRSV